MGPTCYSVNFQRNKAFVGLSDRRTIGLSDYRSDPIKTHTDIQLMLNSINIITAK